MVLILTARVHPLQTIHIPLLHRMLVMLELTTARDTRMHGLHPDGHDAAWRDDPWLGGTVVRGENAVVGGFADEPWEAIEEDIGDDAGDDTVCDAKRGPSAPYPLIH